MKKLFYKCLAVHLYEMAAFLYEVTNCHISKAAAVVSGSGFVALVSATTIEAVMRTLGRNLSGKRARSPKEKN